MRKNILKTVTGLGLAILLTSCGGANVNVDKSSSRSSVNSINYESAGRVSASSAKRVDEDFNKTMDAFANRKLIRNGNVKFETKNIDATEFRIKQAVRKMGAFISFEQQTRNEWSVRTDLEIRMRSDVFEEMLDSICSGAHAIDSKNIKVQDVTEQYVDTESRIATRKLVEQKYVDHLTKAKDIDEVLAIEAKIGQIREEIESAEKRLRKLKDQVALSTLRIEFYQHIQKPVVQESNRFEKAAKVGWSGFESFLVILTAAWPLLLIGLIVLVIVRRYLNKKG